MLTGQGNNAVISLGKGSGAPFPGNSANNGLSVDPGSGQIVLGNDIGLLTAKLLSDRYINTNGFNLNFIEPTTNKQVQVSGDPGTGFILTADYNGPLFSMTAVNSNAGNASNNLIQLYTENHGLVLGSTSTAHTAGFPADACMVYGVTNGGAANLWLIAENDQIFAVGLPTVAGISARNFRPTKNWRFAADGADNGAKLQVKGTGGKLLSLETSGAVEVLSVAATGAVTMISVPRSSQGSVVLRNTGSGVLQTLAGFAAATFTTSDGKTVTVQDGVITNVV